MNKKIKILVTGITGQQGGAVGQELKSRGHLVRGLTRNTESDKAKALADQGFEIVRGDFSEPTSLAQAIEGVDAVFAVSTPFEKGMAAETEQGKTIADAAKEAGVFLVYTSVASANKNTGIPHFDSKYEVEKYLSQIGVEHAVIAPVYFMENIFFPQTKEALDNGTYASPLPPDRKLQQVALADIGALAALVIENREKYSGQRIEIASDTVSGAQEAELLGQSLGQKVDYFQVPMEQIEAMSEDFATMYKWFIDEGYSIDIERLHGDYPDVPWHTMRSWLDKQSLN